MTILMCAWCRRVKRVGEWVVEDPEPVGNVSHGICPDCYEVVNGEPFERWMAVGLDAADYEAAEAEFSARAAGPRGPGGGK